MGSRMAANLLKAGHDVTVWNRTPRPATELAAQGAAIAPSPRSAAQAAEVVISMVTDDDASRTVWLAPETGAAWGLNTGAIASGGATPIAIESSTLTVAWTNELAAAIANQGAAFLDAPVVGSRPQAEAGKLIHLIGGTSETLVQVQGVLLSAGSSAIHHVGPTGHGMAMKLAVNALFGIQVAALAEIIGMLTHSGISSTKAMTCLGELPVISLAAKAAANLMLAHQHDPLFPIDLVAKDFRYMMQTAAALNAVTPVSEAIHAIYQEAIAQGHGNQNITGVANLFLS